MKNSRQIVTINHRPVPIKSKEALAYEKDALRQIPPVWRLALTVPVKVSMWIFYPSERQDLDGALLLDILANRYEKTNGKLVKLADGTYAHGPSERVLVQRGVYENDRLVREIHYYHRIDKNNPRVMVEIETLVPQQAELITEDVPMLQIASPDPF